jgi:hypothetical protein
VEKKTITPMIADGGILQSQRLIVKPYVNLVVRPIMEKDKCGMMH